MKNIALTLLFSGLLTNVGCGDDSKDTGEEEVDGTEETDTTAAGFTPQEGLWLQTTEPVVVSDTCNMPGEDDEDDDEEDEDEDGGVLLTMTGEGTFSLNPVDDSEDSPVFSCSLDGMSFTCDTVSNQMPDEEMDLTLIMSMTIAGTFTSETAGDVGMTMGFDCEGPDCSLMELAGMELPCSSEETFEVTAE